MVYLLEAQVASVYNRQTKQLLRFSYQEECQQFGNHEEGCVSYLLFTSCEQMRKVNMVFAQVVIPIGVHSRKVPVLGLHMNINILYHLLLRTPLNYY